MPSPAASVGPPPVPAPGREPVGWLLLGLLVLVVAFWAWRRETAGALEQASVSLSDGVELAFVGLPGGRFWMGSAPDEAGHQDGEQPRHMVNLSPFQLARTEVDQAQWRAVMGARVFPLPGETLPATGVSWCEALQFCNRLSQAAGLQAVYRFSGQTCEAGGRVEWMVELDGYRLPTEAEWELAARNGGARAPVVACGVGEGALQPVTACPASAWALHGLLGNAAEWVWDPLTAYPDQVVWDPGLFTIERVAEHIVRGGFFASPAADLRPAARAAMPRAGKADWLGFRVARSGS